MPKSNIEVIFITTDDYDRNKEIMDLLSTIPNSKTLDFYTQDIDELSVVAKHRVLPVPTILIINGSRVVGRIVNPPSIESLTTLMQDIIAMCK